MTTTSPNTPQQKVEDQTLLSERAASIGWFFIESYYDFYNNNIENIHKIYRSDASISHNKFPIDAKEPKTIYKASGTEAIKIRFANESTSNSTNRIVVTSANFEVCLADKILIVVCGEWSKNGSSYWQFTQTFLLTPGKKENSFDVANDILVFIDLEETKEEPIIVTDEESVADKADNFSAKETNDIKPEASSKDKKVDDDMAPVTEPSTKDIEEVAVKKESTPEMKPNKKIDQVVEKAESKALEKKPVNISGETETKTTIEVREKSAEKKNEDTKSVTPVATTPVATAAATIGTTTKEPEKKKEKELKKETIIPSQSSEEEPEGITQPGAPLSWAALASQAAPPKHASKPSTASPAQTTATPTSSKAPSQQPQPQPQSQPQSQPQPQPQPQLQPHPQSQPPQPQSQTQTQQQQNIKYKKEDWFPIYIRGVKQLEEKQLKDHLTKKFGGIKFFKPNGNIALCDFFSEESQKKALEAKETTIDNITIQLEHRESKASSNGVKKVKDQKEKINGESKRGRNDKKSNGKKNKSTSS